MNPVFPSILSTNYFDLEHRLQEFISQQTDFIHLDVMDGHFVDNISFGPAAVSSIKARFDLKIDSHLMVDNPDRMIPKFIESGSDWISCINQYSRPYSARVPVTIQILRLDMVLSQ